MIITENYLARKKVFRMPTKQSLCISEVYWASVFVHVSVEDIGIGIDLDSVVKSGGPHFSPSHIHLSIPIPKEFFDLAVGQRILLAVGLSIFCEVPPEGFNNVRTMAIPTLFQPLFRKLVKLFFQLDFTIVFVAGQPFLSTVNAQ